MTLSTTSNTISYTGDNSNTVWTYSFIIPDADFVVVTITDTTDDSSLVLTPSDYSITGINDENGGIVTYPLSGSPLDTDHVISIQRVVPLTQEVDLTNQDGFYKEVVESEFDYLTMITQQLQEQVNRALAFPVGSVSGDDLTALLAAIMGASSAATSAAASATAAAASAAAAASSSGVQTGDVKWRAIQGALTGWVRCNALTIGNAASSATERANADCSDLFSFLWTNFSDSQCAVSGGRGGSAAADFAANKRITLLDLRGRTLGGLASMGGSASGRYTGVTVVSGAVNTAGSVLGENTHVLLETELAQHDHSVTDPGHAHDLHSNTGAGTVALTGGGIVFADGGAQSRGATDDIVTGLTVDNAGSNAAHNNVAEAMLGSWYIKL